MKERKQIENQLGTLISDLDQKKNNKEKPEVKRKLHNKISQKLSKIANSLKDYLWGS